MSWVAGTRGLSQDDQTAFGEQSLLGLKRVLQLGKPPETDSPEGHLFSSPSGRTCGKIILLSL